MAEKKIRVLHLIHSVCHGGIESALINWVTHFDRDRFEIHVACLAHDRNREEPFLLAASIAGFPVVQVPWSRWKPFIRAARAVAQFVRERDIDIVHTHAYYGDAVGALAARFTRVKTVATVYVWGKYELHRQIMHLIDWTALRFVDKVTAHCEDTRRKTIKLGFSAQKVSTLITGFPVKHEPPTPAERLELRRSMGIGDDEFLLVNVARIHPEKAHDQLLASFGKIRHAHPTARLWISGVGSEALERDLLALRKRLGLDDCAEFIGFRQDLWPMLDAADMMVHPSHVEGVPMALQYGMAAGLPIVASDVGGVSEIIKTGRTGMLIPENDTDGFAKCVSSLLDDRSFAAQLGEQARRFVQTDYSIETAVRRVEQTYREVLAI
jgi:glycosyltransferase involved in cell wall biosynthesis